MVGWFVEALMKILRRTGVKRILKKLPAGKSPQRAHQAKKATIFILAKKKLLSDFEFLPPEFWPFSYVENYVVNFPISLYRYKHKYPLIFIKEIQNPF